MIGGRYEVLEMLAQGAQGEVYRVRDHNENAIGVIKLIDVSKLPRGAAAWDEARVLRQLADDHILPIRNADLAGGLPFIVTAFAEHGTLDKRLEATNGLGLLADDVVTWIRQACLGVARAHDVHLIHNDIKPANLFLTGRGDCLVGDFGLASLVLPPLVVGVARGASAQTAAPEVAAGFQMNLPPASVETDVFSLGATAYWLLAAQPPIEQTLHGPDGVRWTAAATHAPSRLRDIAPHVPVALAAVIEKALSHDPLDRYQSVNQLAAALGSRSLPARRWRRTNEHPTHLGCWRGERSGHSTYVLCLEQGVTPTRCTVTTVYESGRRVPGGSRADTMSNWPRAVRATIDRLA
jgi:eukaryotic-like serine/threonine-protein kinase